MVSANEGKEQAMAEERWTAEDVQRVLINPFYAIKLAPSLCLDHAPIVTREEWVQANAHLIEQMGAEAWLARLLEVLEMGALPTEVDEDGEASGGSPRTRQLRTFKQRRLAKRDGGKDGRRR